MSSAVMVHLIHSADICYICLDGLSLRAGGCLFFLLVMLYSDSCGDPEHIPLRPGLSPKDPTALEVYSIVCDTESPLFTLTQEPNQSTLLSSPSERGFTSTYILDPFCSWHKAP